MTVGCPRFFFDAYEGPEIFVASKLTVGSARAFCLVFVKVWRFLLCRNDGGEWSCFSYGAYEGLEISPIVEMTVGCPRFFFDAYEGPEIFVASKLTVGSGRAFCLVFVKVWRFLLSSK